MKPKKLCKEPATPGKKADEAPYGQERPCTGYMKRTASPAKNIMTPTRSSAPKTPNSVASRCALCWPPLGAKPAPSALTASLLPSD